MLLLIAACGRYNGEQSVLAKKRDCAAEGRRFFERFVTKNPEWTYPEPEFAYDRKRDSCVCFIMRFGGGPPGASEVKEEIWNVLSNNLVASRFTAKDGSQVPEGAGSVDFTNMKAELFDER